MKKDLAIIGIVIVLVVVLVMGVNIQSVDEYYSSHLDEITEDSQTVFMSIRCDTILNNYDKLDEKLKDEKYVPADGIISERKEYVLRKNETALELLMRITRYYKINRTARGDYVESINEIYEFSCGSLSGWMFKLNGVEPSTSSDIKLKDGDEVEWLYSCELGNDL